MSLMGSLLDMDEERIFELEVMSTKMSNFEKLREKKTKPM